MMNTTVGKAALRVCLQMILLAVFAAVEIRAWSAAPQGSANDSAWSDPGRLAPPPAGAVGFPSRDPGLDVLPGFVKPPAGYGQVPFWWWMGDPLTKERIAWQLDKLKECDAAGMQVNYCHTDQGGRSYGLTFPSDPKLFTEPWWDLFSWTLGEAKKRGMAVSLSDYTLCTPGQGSFTDEILKEHPEMHGRLLNQVTKPAAGGREFTMTLPEGLLSVVALPAGGDGAGKAIDLQGFVAGAALKWQAPAGAWRVVAVCAKDVPQSLDPMNPQTGAQVIDKFFGRFEKHNPGEGGKGLNFFFSDELNFGIGGNMWNDRFAEEFKKRKGYDIVPELAAIFTDIGPRTPKVRLDYYDVLVQLSEEGYFRPVFQWHYDRGMVYGCDHGGRGKAVTEFGDYFRTQRWMTGPGCDQPQLGHDIIKNKVASSIAHLYQRPRAWSEEFHSTGWAANTDQMTAATNENWVSGMTVLTMHGLYYSTHGGWWEWAPPCFHFRMPYWPHMAEWLKSYERLSYLLSQGVHRCDVAILYPVSPLQAGMQQPSRRGQLGDGKDAVSLAFGAGQFLFDRGIDFDFMDDDSLARAEIRDKGLEVSGERFRVLILPAMAAVRQKTLELALKFKRAGGIVIALGALPEASDKNGRDDKGLDALVKELFGVTAREAQEGQRAARPKSTDAGFGLLAANNEDLAATITAAFPRDFAVADGRDVKSHVLHRKIGARDVFMVTQAPKGTVCNFRATGKAELWDFWSGTTKPLPVVAVTAAGTSLRLPLTESEAQLIVFTPGEPENEGDGAAAQAPTQTVALDGNWEFELQPTMDNRFGDFRLPVTEANKTIGAEARRFAYSRVDPKGWEGCVKPEFDDSKWSRVTYSYAPHFMKLGPVPASAVDQRIEDQLSGFGSPPDDEYKPVKIGGRTYKWEPYEFSMREGIWNEPGHQGYHGLKESVSDDFIALGKKVASRTKKNDVEFVAEPGGTVYYLKTFVRVKKGATKLRQIHGDYQPSQGWLAGLPFTDLRDKNGMLDFLDTGNAALLLRYDGPGRGHFILQADGSSYEAPPYPLAMKWYTLPGVLPFDPLFGGYDCYRFTAPPGLRSMSFALQGELLKAYAAGKEIAVMAGAKRSDGAREYIVTIDKPEPGPAVVALVVGQATGHSSGAAFPEPIRLTCGKGELAAGDWSKVGVLESYSGGAWYRKTVTLTPEQARGGVTLNLGQVISTAEVRVNGQKAGIRMCAPWTLDISKWVRAGENRIEILVYSTLSNHYSTIPTKYRGDLAAGLIGPVGLALDSRPK